MTDYLFSGLKVLDVSTVIAAPAAATILADFGASVIKVEQPPVGDMLRLISEVPSTPDADGPYLWQMLSGNKRGLTLNLKTPRGLEVLRALCDECDVYITNQPHSVRERFGLTYPELKGRNPCMIYASITAYGEVGPERDRKAFDQLAYWARSGLMELMREPDAPPTQGLPGMGDHPTAMSLYAAIVTALLHRERTGAGTMVHTSLLANGLWSAACVAQGAMAGGNMERYREVNRVPAVLWRVYRTKDDRWLQLNMIRTEDEVRRLFEAIEAPHILEDARFAEATSWWEHRGVLGELIQGIILTRDSDDWLARFQSAALPVNRIAVVEETVNDPQVLANEMVRTPSPDAGIAIPLIVSHPIKVDGLPRVEPTRAPDRGEHAEEILKELGYDDAAIAEMRDAGVI